MQPHQDIRDWLRERLIGYINNSRRLPALEELQQTQWSTRFEQAMRARLIMGAFRYAPLGEQGKSAPRYDNIGEAIRRLKEYLRAGDPELLIDVANLCMIEYVMLGEPDAVGSERVVHTPKLGGTRHVCPR